MSFIGVIRNEIEQAGTTAMLFAAYENRFPTTVRDCHYCRNGRTYSLGASTKLHVHASLHVQRCDGFTTEDRARLVTYTVKSFSQSIRDYMSRKKANITEHQ